MTSSIQIIGGQFRGKKITFINADGLRPTPNRIRETLFNWLMHSIHQACCLDAFAGSGALGLEAFSRGAACVYFVEHHPATARHLQKTLLTWPHNKLYLQHQDFLTFSTNAPSNQFDIIFFDPPFSNNKHHLQLLDTQVHRILKPKGFLYLETPEITPLNPEKWTNLKQKKAGQVYYALFQKNNRPEAIDNTTL